MASLFERSRAMGASVADRKALLSGGRPAENLSELIDHIRVQDAR
jgi:hypothetical protein